MKGTDMGAALRSATEHLNDLLKKAQALLVRGNLGVEAFVPIDEHEGHTLGFAKRNADWVLVYTHPGGAEQPLLAASRSARILGALHLDKLRRQIALNATALWQDLGTAIESVESYVATESNGDREGGDRA